MNGYVSLTDGADFDVVVDDGGHMQCQIWTTFLKLWPQMKPGGLYFIEDLQVSRWDIYARGSSPICPEGTNVVDKTKEILDAIVHGQEHETVKDVKFIFCQREACMLGK